MAYPRNSASPPPVPLGAIYSTADGSLVTSGAAVRVRVGTAAWAAGSGSLNCDATTGFWDYVPTQAETDADSLEVVAYKSGATLASAAVTTSASALAGYLGVDWSKVGNPTTQVGLTATSIKNAADSDTAITAISQRLPAQLDGGKLVATVGAYQAGMSPLTTLGTNAPPNWLNAAAIAADAIGSSQVATSAVTKLQSGLSTSTSVEAVLTAVQAIPVNPLLTNDVRLANLDYSIAAVNTAITNLNNLSALINLYGSPLLEIPDSGATVFAFTVVVRDNEGKLVNLDSSPTLAAANAAGTSRSANLSAVSTTATGRYLFTYSVASTHAPEPLRITVSGTVSSEPRYIEWIGNVVNYDTLTVLQSVQTTVSAIESRLPSLPAAVTDIPTSANVATAVRNELNTELARINADISSRSTLTAADVRTAVGLSQPDLGTQLASIKTDTGAILDDTGTSGVKLEANAVNSNTLEGTAATEIAGAVDATLTTAHGAGTWGGGSTGGDGAYIVTLTVTDGVAPLQNAVVRMAEGATTLTGQTNVMGVVAFSVNPATYAIAIAKTGFSFAPTTLVVLSSLSHTYAMTATTVPVNTDPARSIVVITCYAEDTSLDSKAQITVVQKTPPANSTNGAFDATPKTFYANHAGVVTLTLWRDATYRIIRGKSPPREITPTTAVFNINSIIGTP